MIILSIGVFIGGFIGIIMMSLFSIGKGTDKLNDVLYNNYLSTKVDERQGNLFYSA